MKAARFHAQRDVRVEDVPEPREELDRLQVLLRPRWCGICGTDLHEYLADPIVPSRPHPLTGATLPQILGHEFSADVVAVGADVRSRVTSRARLRAQPPFGGCTPDRG